MSADKTWSVYQATSPSRKVYIGQTVKTIEQRWIEHVWHATHGGTYRIHAAIRKYGAKSFIVVSLGTAASRKTADQLERELIAQYRSHERAYGYNLTLGGDGCSMTEEVKVKMRQAKQHISSETKRKISAALKGNLNCLGNIQSETARAKIGAAQAAYWATTTPEYRSARARHARSKQGVFSPSTIAKIQAKATAWRNSDASIGWRKDLSDRFRLNNYRTGKVPWNKGLKNPCRLMPGTIPLNTHTNGV